MNYFEFKNEGEIPVNAFKLLGASTKRDSENKIGFFGTGLKYALAVMLREDIDFKIYIGEKPLNIGLRRTDFAGEKVEVITVNNEKTSITLDAGIDWEPWFAIREVYSNTIDEGGKLELVERIKPEKDKTSIYIEVSENFGDVARNWQDYFSFKRESLSESSQGRLLSKRPTNPNFTVFRRGVRVHHTGDESLFDYDINNLEINEARTAKFTFEPLQRSSEVLRQSDNEYAVKHFIDNADEKYIEHQNDLWKWSSVREDFSETWFRVLEGKRIVPREYGGLYGVTRQTVLLPEMMVRALYNHFGDRLHITGHTKEKYLITEDYNEKLEPALSLLEEFGFGYDRNKIKTVKFNDKDTYGMYDDSKDLVLISERLMKPNVIESDRATILLEEILHAKSGAGDNTREFQNYLLKSMFALMSNGRES